ncbi:MAG: cupin domain-containing protein [Actinomycetota bacterium]|nr:cupin domain-containing protein [Actinomycetota bacterium]
MDEALTAIIDGLGLEPHPEGGWFRETWRGEPGADGRSVGTSIYFAVSSESPSRLHRVDAVELFHWYAGDEVEQLVIDGSGRAEVRRIGPDLRVGGPQAVVPAEAWQGLHVPAPGRWALLGCTVSPGFEFEGFELATGPQVDELLAGHPAHRDLIDLLR